MPTPNLLIRSAACSNHTRCQSVVCKELNALLSLASGSSAIASSARKRTTLFCTLTKVGSLTRPCSRQSKTSYPLRCELRQPSFWTRYAQTTSQLLSRQSWIAYVSSSYSDPMEEKPKQNFGTARPVRPLACPTGLVSASRRDADGAPCSMRKMHQVVRCDAFGCRCANVRPNHWSPDFLEFIIDSVGHAALLKPDDGFSNSATIQLTPFLISAILLNVTVCPESHTRAAMLRKAR